ncbi:hypothetical protein Ddc_21555 [Ditylenchus destructor]|nr:hypothetical protein Ddc_21555 [Ditylenchus destructor]
MPTFLPRRTPGGRLFRGAQPPGRTPGVCAAVTVHRRGAFVSTGLWTTRCQPVGGAGIASQAPCQGYGRL